MNEELKKSLDDRILEDFKNLSGMKLGDKERSSAIEDLERLYKLYIEEIKVEMDTLDKYEKRRIEEQVNEVSKKEKRFDRWINTIVACLELGVPMIFFGRWLKRGYKFEETGTYTSQTFRTFWSRLKPGK